ncbi:hypothetical protein BT63DRAFT_416442 [Microthyrium microscopicum]|uniref:BTB domain-containing protein n=1 Tax=Microthyrium microscopicum TaxID=703497 RepID=A0A6A6U4Y6_9PEZI|nr:hypothetical protein BT63DRAFT_416442 [Microthyrium microscopicum]
MPFTFHSPASQPIRCPLGREIHEILHEEYYAGENLSFSIQCAEGEVVKCHKVVAQAGSKVMREYLQSCQSDSYDQPDSEKYPALYVKEIVRFWYTGFYAYSDMEANQTFSLPWPLQLQRLKHHFAIGKCASALGVEKLPGFAIGFFEQDLSTMSFDMDLTSEIAKWLVSQGEPEQQFVWVFLVWWAKAVHDAYPILTNYEHLWNITVEFIKTYQCLGFQFQGKMLFELMVQYEKHFKANLECRYCNSDTPIDKLKPTDISTRNLVICNCERKCELLLGVNCPSPPPSA